MPYDVPQCMPSSINKEKEGREESWELSHHLSGLFSGVFEENCCASSLDMPMRAVFMSFAHFHFQPAD